MPLGGPPPADMTSDWSAEPDGGLPTLLLPSPPRAPRPCSRPPRGWRDAPPGGGRPLRPPPSSSSSSATLSTPVPPRLYPPLPDVGVRAPLPPAEAAQWAADAAWSSADAPLSDRAYEGGEP